MKRFLLPCILVLGACGADSSSAPAPAVDSMATTEIETIEPKTAATEPNDPTLSGATSPPKTTSTTPTTTPAPPSAPSTPSPTIEPNSPRTLTCDAEAASPATFTVPSGTNVTLVATSAEEHEFHLHNYDIELSGTRVTFQFTASILGPSQLTLHPGHDVVCTVIVN